MTKARGRPSAFQPEFVEQAERLCLVGATDDELARVFNVSNTTINNWTDIPQVALVGERLPSQPCVCNRDDAFLVMYDAPRGTLVS